ncbi:hypothetical protein [Halobacillus mangrovi]|uniref:hypothetical protein n=1 Tax=Halobacillus mangrovi TaxID=402384 RepID=UPI003D99C103
MDKKIRMWITIFSISLLALLGIYYFAFDFQYLDYSVTEEGQFVLHEGLNEPGAIVNSDVSDKQDSLSILGSYMDQFNKWVLVFICVIPFFMATYAVLFNDQLMKDALKKKKYLSITVIANVTVLSIFVYQWIRSIELVNDAYHNVMF